MKREQQQKPVGTESSRPSEQIHHQTLIEEDEQLTSEAARNQHRTEERYKALSAISTQLVWFTDAEGAFAEDNPLWRSYTGQSVQEAEGRGWRNAVHPDDHKLFMLAWSRAFADKRLYEVECRLRRFDGVYHTFVARGVPTLDEDGDVIEWVNICNDVTERKKLEEAHREFEWYLRTTFEQAAVGMMFLGLDGKMHRINSWLCNLLGYTHDELQGHNIQQLSAPDELSDDLAYIRAVNDEPIPPFVQEKRYRRKDGSSVWVLLTLTPIYKPSGTLSHITALVQDISQRKDLEERLQVAANEAQTRATHLEAIFNSMIDNVFIYDTRGNVMRLNNAVREFAPDGSIPEGYNERSMAERTASYAMRDEHGHLLSEDELPMKRVLRGEVLKGSKAVDVIFRQPNGQDMQVSMSGTPIRDREGKIIGALCISRDVTERRQLERRTHEALDALVAMAQTLVETPPNTDLSESAPFSSATYLVVQRIVELTQRVLGCYRTGMLAVNADLPTIYPMATVGFTAEQEHRWFTTVTGSANSQFTQLLLDPDIHARLRSKETLLLDTQQPSFEHIAAALDVRSILLAPVCVEDRLIAVLYADHGSAEHSYTPEEISLVEAMTRLTLLAIERERRATELARLLSVLQKTNEQLEQVNKLQSDFITIVSHEFRTTLTGIQGFSELLRDEEFSKTEVKEYADDINMDAKRLTRMITELLDLERMKLGKMTLHLESVDLNTLLSGIAERTNLTTQQHKALLKLDEALPRVEGDRDKLTQVVANLVTNAVKYSPQGGDILLSSSFDGQQVHLTVRDYGIGIPPESLEQVFVPYSRIEAGTTRYIQGTGLGLPIVRQIVQMHGGVVWVESTPGEGSTFHIVLPIKQVHSLPQNIVK